MLLQLLDQRGTSREYLRAVPRRRTANAADLAVEELDGSFKLAKKPCVHLRRAGRLQLWLEVRRSNATRILTSFDGCRNALLLLGRQPRDLLGHDQRETTCRKGELHREGRFEHLQVPIDIPA